MLKESKALVNTDIKNNTDWISAPSLSFGATISAIIGFSVFITAINFSSRTTKTVPETFNSPDLSNTISLLHPGIGEMVDSVFPTFSWASVDNATSYQLRIFLKNGSPYWQISSADTSVKLPSDVVLIPGNQYLWRVVVFMPDKKTIQSNFGSFIYRKSATNSRNLSDLAHL